MGNLPPSKQYYAGIKRFKRKPKEISCSIKDRNGNIFTDKESILEHWAEFYKELYHDDPTGIIVNKTCEDAIPEIFRTKVEQACVAMVHRI